MGRLTTHVLDTALGRPAAGLGIDLFAEDSPGVWRHVKSVVTNADGRVDSPLLGPDEMAAGAYELLFHAGEYLKATSAAVTNPPFLDQIPIRFKIADPAAHYHVPLLVSAFAYSTYRGS